MSLVFERSHLRGAFGEYFDAGLGHPNHPFAATVDRVAGLDREAADFHRLIDRDKPYGRVVYNRSSGKRMKGHCREASEVAQPTVGYDSDATHRMKVLRHTIAEDALMVGTGTDCFHHPDCGLRHFLDLLQLLEKEVEGGVPTWGAGVHFAGHGGANHRAESWGQALDCSAHVALVRWRGIDVVHRVGEQGGVEFCQVTVEI